MSIKLWTEVYRPSQMSDYVWRDPNMRKKAEEWIAEGALPHLLLSGKSGLGKTSLAKLLLAQLRVPKTDILEINVSGRARKIEGIEERIMGFISTYPEVDNPHQIKYVLMEEADSMSRLSQRFLRAELERNTDHVRFIFTCNYLEKIEPAIVGRCQAFHFEALNQEEFIMRLVNILETENVQFETDVLTRFIDVAYPDLRKCIGLVQQNTINGVLHSMNATDGNSFDYIAEVADLFRKGQHRKAREMIISQAAEDEYPEIFRFLYQNLELWGDNHQQMDRAIIIIRDGLYKHSVISDAEINLSATILELSQIRQQ